MQLLEHIVVDKDLNNYLAKNSAPLVESSSKLQTITNKDVPKVRLKIFDKNIFVHFIKK